MSVRVFNSIFLLIKLYFLHLSKLPPASYLLNVIIFSCVEVLSLKKLVLAEITDAYDCSLNHVLMVLMTFLQDKLLDEGHIFPFCRRKCLLNVTDLSGM